MSNIGELSVPQSSSSPLTPSSHRQETAKQVGVPFFYD